jgi:hypothetical protein
MILAHPAITALPPKLYRSKQNAKNPPFNVFSIETPCNHKIMIFPKDYGCTILISTGCKSEEEAHTALEWAGGILAEICDKTAGTE